MLKIGILGTRGIPNNYGGFEQCAEQLALHLSEKGYDVFVYTSHNHPYKKNKWKKVNLIHQFNPEKLLGTFGQFVYDFNCLKDAGKRKFNVLLQLGYTSSAIFHLIWPKECPNIINMDGLEHKRSKYNKYVQAFLNFSEKLAVKHADLLIADSLGIKDYIEKKYQKEAVFIPYGAELYDASKAIGDFLPENLIPYKYDLLIARMEKENNIESIINAFLKSESKKLLVLVGDYSNKYGQYLYNKYSHHKNIKFLGSIYNSDRLNNLRYFSHLYYHGHSVGGTNPSLLEAMASNAMIVAHQNEFNKAVLGDDAYYFSDETDLKDIIQSGENSQKREDFILNNQNKISSIYNWELVSILYEKYMHKAIEIYASPKEIRSITIE